MNAYEARKTVERITDPEQKSVLAKIREKIKAAAWARKSGVKHVINRNLFTTYIENELACEGFMAWCSTDGTTTKLNIHW